MSEKSQVFQEKIIDGGYGGDDGGDDDDGDNNDDDEDVLEDARMRLCWSGYVLRPPPPSGQKTLLYLAPTRT